MRRGVNSFFLVDLPKKRDIILAKNFSENVLKESENERCFKSGSDIVRAGFGLFDHQFYHFPFYVRSDGDDGRQTGISARAGQPAVEIIRGGRARQPLYKYHLVAAVIRYAPGILLPVQRAFIRLSGFSFVKVVTAKI